MPWQARIRDAAQVFSVVVTGINEPDLGFRWPLEMYGFVAARDNVDYKRNIIFRRDRDNCQTLTAEVSAARFELEAGKSSCVMTDGQFGRQFRPSDVLSVNIVSEESNSDMSISSDDEGIKQLMEASIELSEENGDDQANDLLTQEPDLGMTFDSEDSV
ncbi:hypothetical protein PR202_ga25259 [Eleusine coracana subsp. coracana]|uniref:DUF6598 domain-containing protein n=1 Tax=Eleusine coracana subsp. coracana TaxID=191504 RepID=A0AAV5DAH7_ELECO|nr:hypothetical protein PR202_ga25259 [Eleusine coracana subsp. coracana]